MPERVLLHTEESPYESPHREGLKGGKDQTEFNNRRRGEKAAIDLSFSLSYPFQDIYINFNIRGHRIFSWILETPREKAGAIIKVITSFNKEDRIISLLPPHRILKRENPPLQGGYCSILSRERERNAKTHLERPNFSLN